MDEANRIALELTHKLQDLDRAVWRYRQDMTAEFNRYAEGLLRDLPEDVSESVSKTIAAKMKNYPSLCSDCQAPSESQLTGTNCGDQSQSPTATTATTFLRPKDQEGELTGSLHEREKEFRGVFTPSFLPLLDSTNKRERRPNSDALKSPPPGRISPQPRVMEPLQVDASTSTTRSLVSSPVVSRPTTPRRRNTDEVSVSSDVSEKRRRSALRRSSSSSRHSPRRVRFEVAGGEVLPTASPRDSKLVLSADSGADAYGEMDDEPALEQIEDVEDSPPPKRISSSQALRALSRSPLVDDGTIWTSVEAPADGSPSVETNGVLSSDSSTLTMKTLGNGASQMGSINALMPPTKNGLVDGSADEPPSEEADDTSDDDLLDMPPLKRQGRSPSSMLSPVSIKPANPASTTTTRPSRAYQHLENLGHKSSAEKVPDLKNNAGDDDDELFSFDEQPPPQPSPGVEDEEYDDFDAETPVSPTSIPLSKYSSSPAREIIKPNTPQNPPPSRGVVGSYKGQPFSMPIVSPDVHARAASLGTVNTFVGSVDGISGVDESNVQSFSRPGGVGSFSGTPRSMSERMMLDDEREADEEKRRQ